MFLVSGKQLKVLIGFIRSFVNFSWSFFRACHKRILGVATFMGIFSMLFHADSTRPREGEIKACLPEDSMMREETTGREGRHDGEERLGGALRALVKVRLGVLGDLEQEKVSLIRLILVFVL